MVLEYVLFFKFNYIKKTWNFLIIFRLFFKESLGFRISTKNNCMALKARSLDDLQVIIAHFDKT